MPHETMGLKDIERNDCWDTKEKFHATVPPKSKQIVINVVAACDGSMPRRRNNAHKLPELWWNDESRQLGAEYLQARRNY